MRKNRFELTGTVIALGLLTTVTALAIDIGDPVYKKDVSGSFRVEGLYENFDRDINFNMGDVTITRPDGRQSTARLKNDSSSTEEKLYIVRLSCLAIDKATFYLDAGAINDDEAESTPYMVGAGAHVLAYERDKLRLNIVANGHYVPSFDAQKTENDPELGRIEDTGSVDYYEAAAGATLSGDIALGVKTQLIPYGGFLYSILRGNGDQKGVIQDSGIQLEASSDVKEDNAVVGVAGLSLLFQKQFSLRVEGRFIGDSSWSAALGAAF